MVVGQTVGRVKKESMVVLSGRQPSGVLLRWKRVEMLTVLICAVERIVLDFRLVPNH